MKKLSKTLGLAAAACVFLLCGCNGKPVREPVCAPAYIWAINREAPMMSSVISHSDWYTWRHANSGRPGVRYILSRCAASGIRRVYYRLFGGGQALYPSRLDAVTMRRYAEAGQDYADFDHLAETVEFGHELGLEVYAWYTFLEENHAWRDHVRSRYLDTHPWLWDADHRGAVLDTVLSFAYPEYRDQRLAFAKEVLHRYEVDGLMLDFERRGSPGRSDRTGYCQKALEDFASQTGRTDQPEPDDEAWCKHRAGYVNAFLRDLRGEAASAGRPVKLVAMIPANTNGIRSIVDLETWQDEGLFDRICLIHYGGAWGTCGSPEAAFSAAPQIKCQRGFILYTYKGEAKDLANSLREAKALDLAEVNWFETGVLDSRNLWNLVASAVEYRNVLMRRRIVLDRRPVSAELALSADCKAEIYVNAEKVGETEGYRKVIRLDVLSQLHAGPNVIALKAAAIQKQGRAGLAAKLKLAMPGGREQLVVSGDDWLVAVKRVKPGWEKTDYDDSEWGKADVVGLFGLWPRFWREEL